MSTSIPLPGRHRRSDVGNEAVENEAVENEAVEAGAIEMEVDRLLDRLPSDRDAPMNLDVQAQILERAHDVLVHALSSVDKN